jgi:hypothetical protein
MAKTAISLGQLVWDNEHIPVLELEWLLCNLTVVPSMQGGASIKEAVPLNVTPEKGGKEIEDKNSESENEHSGNWLHTRKLQDIFQQFHSLPLP